MFFLKSSSLSVMALCSSAMLHGGSSVQSQEMNPNKNSVQASMIAEQNTRQEWQPISASASVDSGFTVDASFLYWQARESGLEYVATAAAALLDATHIKTQVAVRDLKFEWNPGVKVNIGYIFPQQQQWELAAGWTYMFSKAHGSKKVPDATGFGPTKLFPIWNPTLLGGVALNASAQWSTHYNVFDLSLERHYFVGKWLALKPMVGVRGAWIDQRYNVSYTGRHALLDFYPSSIKAVNDFSGGGLRVGTDIQWLASSHWSILGSFSASMIYGHFSVRQHLQGAVELDNPGILFFDNQRFKAPINRFSPNVEGKLGVQWHTFFNDGKYYVSLGAFYDMVYWGNQNQLVNPMFSLDQAGPIDLLLNIKRQNGDLQYQGASVQLRFEF